MKKLLSLVGAMMILTACANSDDINASRGLNSSRITKAELDQYNKQRANEVTEAQTQAMKAQGYSETIRQASSAIQAGTNAIQSVLSIFGH